MNATAGRPRRRWHATGALIVFLVLVIAGESALLHEQRTAGKARTAQSDQLLTAFLHGDTASVASGRAVLIGLRNVRFEWSRQVYVDAGQMAVRAVPVRGTVVDFDDLDSFHLVLQRSVVLIRPDVLAGMFNESIFNYPGSRVRKLEVALSKDDAGIPTVELKGKVNFVTWLPFTMYTHLSVDTAANAMVIEVDHLKLFGFIPATKLIRWTPLHLDRLIALPPNKSLRVEGIRIYVKPFGLFPPPRISGRIASLEVGETSIRISFAGDSLAPRETLVGNYVSLSGGAAKFGNFRMADTDVLLRDQDPSDLFTVSLLHYAELLPACVVESLDTRSVRMTMPDYSATRPPALVARMVR